MGLDTTHDCWHGSYIAFTHWRHMLARAAGYGFVKPADGYGEMVLIDWGHITESNIAGVWEQTPADPLIVLLAHSDCDGAIYPAQAGPLADRIEELMPKMRDDSLRPEVFGYYRQRTQKFIDGLRQAAAAGEPVEFH